MISYIPVVSQLTNSQHDACLVDPKALKKKYDLKGTVVVSKAEVFPLACDSWWFTIEDDGKQVVLYKHIPGYKCPSVVDVIQILGHQLTLLPKQKLLFHTDGELEQSVTFITIK